jgi:outer membrane receptor protein involved in Fe transport
MKNKTGNYSRGLAAGAARTMPAGSRSGTAVATASCLALCLVTCGVQSVHAADQVAEEETQLETVVVTGSLIPETQAEAARAQPVIVITAEDLQDRGFATVADALQHGSFSTGSVQNGQYSGGFTQGAQTLLMFGLDPSYTKFLIDGLPIADYPALYNGTINFASIGGIPTVMIDRIEVLPGGQSSIYGSDAIAGVVNIILKKKLDAPVFDVRYGWTEKGGGEDLRLGAADSWSVGKLNILVGGQYDKTDPIWAFQRPLTKTSFDNGTSPQTAERDYLVEGLFGMPNGEDYYFEDPANCANVAGQFGDTVRKVARPGRGEYCGTDLSGQYTIGNGDESTQGYLHGTFDLSDNVQVYANLLANHEATRISVGPRFYGNTVDQSSPTYLFEDPKLGDLMILQHIFSPEESGGYDANMNKDTLNSYRATVGVQGNFGSSSWTYDVGMTYTDQKLTEHYHVLFSQPIENFFGSILGPQLGYDPVEEVYLYEPNYAAFYKPVTPAQYASFSGYVNSYSYTEESLARAQVTDASLFTLPGGKAGLALVFEGGDQGWNYAPDPGYFDNAVYGITSTAGSGHRSRYAGTGELRLPVINMLTLSASGRYDDYRVSGGNVDKATYNLGLEFRPLTTLLFRGRYGTAFKAPTLADEFQGESGSYTTLTDYYTCAKNGFTGTNLGNCAQANQSYFLETKGNSALQPITAKVYDIGTVFSPLERLSLNADFLHWTISNEVTEESADQLLRTESLCRLGTYNINSPSCVAALSQVTRDAAGMILNVLTPKINVSQEVLNVFQMGGDYKMHAGRIGELDLEISWTDILKHDYLQYAGQPPYDLLANPVESQEFKSKANAALTWTKGDLSATYYVERYGHTPNYLATIYGYGTPGAGTLATLTLSNISARYHVTSAFVVSAAVQNLFNSMPPVDRSYPGTETQPYDEFDYSVYGRTYYVQGTYKFGK